MEDTPSDTVDSFHDALDCFDRRCRGGVTNESKNSNIKGRHKRSLVHFSNFPIFKPMTKI
jgi:hypothetical protein